MNKENNRHMFTPKHKRRWEFRECEILYRNNWNIINLYNSEKYRIVWLVSINELYFTKTLKPDIESNLPAVSEDKDITIIQVMNPYTLITHLVWWMQMTSCSSPLNVTYLRQLDNKYWNKSSNLISG